MPDPRMTFISTFDRPIESNDGLKLLADNTIRDDIACDVIIVPGGFGIHELIDNKDVINWLRKFHNESTYTVAVCIGALL